MMNDENLEKFISIIVGMFILECLEEALFNDLSTEELRELMKEKCKERFEK